ncbi:MAG TPA: 2,3-bisphosphoglycerate-independent phosphoglycerate mutase [Alphaproteobacteria bacterium]|nr:2,3-bisphosphoglycerate-independent phosphoglycerate mutase [Alphaproteobacteria bacterium]
MSPDKSRTRRPVVLCVLDGWGYRGDKLMADDAIRNAKTPNLCALGESSPHGLLNASELFVGLPTGQMGNSEVGHMNLGAGRVVMQELPRIDAAIADGSLKVSPVLADFVAKLKASGGVCHLMGLISDGGVHSHQDQIAALARYVGEAGVKVVVHAFLDGRDTPPSSAKGFVEKFETDIHGKAAIGTVSGRYYAMDRDKRWDRVELAYKALMFAEGQTAAEAQTAIDISYAAGKTDEFMLPTILPGYEGMKDGDGILMGNFRADRAREILAALLDPAFDGFARAKTPRFAAALGLVEYSSSLGKLMGVLFPATPLSHILGEVLAAAGKTQLRIAETEKYAHVTFFFNGGEEKQFPGEERILVASPKVATYDLQPEMSAPEVTDKLVAAIESDKFDFVLVNYANTDMVGHSGIFDAAVKAVEAVDACIGRLAAAVKKMNGALIITADHGNAEMMSDPMTHQPHTAHTTNLVPMLLVNAPEVAKIADGGALADVAPTVLDLMGLPQPKEMTGHSLLIKAGGAMARADRVTA